MDLALRDGLVEVPGGLPTFASIGLETRAALIGDIAADSYSYIADLLGFRPEAQVLVLSEADWPTRTETPLYTRVVRRGRRSGSRGVLARIH